MFLVLYSHQDNRWKLTDFGISAEATSQRARSTRYSRGTSSYRAPELLNEQATFTKRVDIWALGCVLYELASGKVAFHEDWAVREYYNGKADLSISIPSLPPFLLHHVSNCIKELHHRDWTQRPPAAEVLPIFKAYCRFLRLSNAPELMEIVKYPSYQKWKELVKTYPSKHDFLSGLADAYELEGERGAAISLREKLIGHNAIDTARHTYLEADESLSSEWLEIIEAAIEEHPTNFWLWHHLCQIYIRRADFDSAIKACSKENIRSLANPSPALALCNVYAAKRDFPSAIRLYGEIIGDRDESTFWDNILAESEREIISLSANTNLATCMSLVQ